MLARGVSSREGHSGKRRPALGRSDASEEHRAFALRAFGDLLRDSRFDNRAPPEKEADPVQGATGRRAQPTEVPDGHEALGQDMEQPAPDQFVRSDRLNL